MQINFKPCVDAAERMGNIRAALLRGLETLPIFPAHGREMVLCCYGPSLIDTLSSATGDVFSVSGAHDVLLDAGIVPRAHVECDPRPHKAKFLTRPHKDVTYFIASCCHPDVFDALKGYEVVLWHSDQSDDEARLIGQAAPGAPLVLGGSTVGTRALSVGSCLGYRQFRILGMDCSFSDEQHAGRHPNPNPNEISVTAYGRTFCTTTNLVLAVQDLLKHAEDTKSYRYVLGGDGLLQHIAANIGHSRIRIQSKSLGLQVRVAA